MFWGPAGGYDLGYLAEFLPNLNKHKPRQSRAAEREGLGRNVSTWPPNAASSHMGAKYGAATSLRSCCVVFGDQDGWGTMAVALASRFW